MKSRAGENCCSHDDKGVEGGVKWSFGKDSYEVEVTDPRNGEKQIVPVPREREVTNGAPCGIGPMVWWYPSYDSYGKMTPVIKCFWAGAGG